MSIFKIYCVPMSTSKTIVSLCCIYLYVGIKIFLKLFFFVENHLVSALFSNVKQFIEKVQDEVQDF